MNTVYLLEHRDIEDDKYVRAVYARSADAERDIFAPEVSDNWILEQYAQGRPIFGRREPRWQEWDAPLGGKHRRWIAETTVNIRSVREHGDWCCGVEPYSVLAESTLPVIVDA